MTQQALIIIDLQNDYFPEGQFPLWNTDGTLSNIKAAIALAHDKHIPIATCRRCITRHCTVF